MRKVGTLPATCRTPSRASSTDLCVPAATVGKTLAATAWLVERRRAGPVVGTMSHTAAPPRPKTVSDISERISELISEAIAEGDNARRRGLLALADIWADIRRSRVAADPATGRRNRK